MDDWRPATVDEVRQAIERERGESDPAIWASRASMLVDPQPCDIQRFGTADQVFIVARSGKRVVFFDDVEDDFGTAEEVDGRLKNCAWYGPLILALAEAAREGG